MSKKTGYLKLDDVFVLRFIAFPVMMMQVRRRENFRLQSYYFWPELSLCRKDTIASFLSGTL